SDDIWELVPVPIWELVLVPAAAVEPACVFGIGLDGIMVELVVCAEAVVMSAVPNARATIAVMGYFIRFTPKGGVDRFKSPTTVALVAFPYFPLRDRLSYRLQPVDKSLPPNSPNKRATHLRCVAPNLSHQ